MLDQNLDAVCPRESGTQNLGVWKFVWKILKHIFEF